MHDGRTDLAYADQRYYATGAGRFMTADPFGGGAEPDNPSSWNRYNYALGDPIGAIDPAGLAPGTIANDVEEFSGCVQHFIPAADAFQDASSFCAPGFLWHASGAAAAAANWRLETIRRATDSISDLIEDWDYTNPAAGVNSTLAITLTPQTSAALLQNGFVGPALAGAGAGAGPAVGGLIIIGGSLSPPGWVVWTVGGVLVIGGVAIRNADVLADWLKRAVAGGRKETPGERTIRCANEYLKDLGVCASAYPNDPQALAACYEAARQKKDRCLGIGVN